MLSCPGCTWREGYHGGHDLDRGCVDIVDDTKGLLLVPVRYCVVCMSRFPLSLPLSLPLPDRVPAVVVAAAVVSRLHLEGRTSW